MKEELTALPLTLLGSYYVIITLGGGTRTAAIWGTVIALAVHLAASAINKDDK